MLCLVSECNEPMTYLAAHLTFRDEAPYLREWIEFHILAGIEHFYLYDNRSGDNPERILAPYIAEGLVTYVPWNAEGHPHRRESLEVRLDFCRRFGHEAHWVAFLDADEFLFPTSADVSLRDVLRDYDAYPAVGVGWLMFGANGVQRMTSEPVISRFTRRRETPERAHFKTIAKPSRIVAAPNPHYFLYLNGERAVTEDFRPIPEPNGSSDDTWAIGFIEHVSYERLRINHYPLKSYEEYNRFKVRKDDESPVKLYTPEYFRITEENCSVQEDLTIRRYLPELLRRLSAREAAVTE